MTVDATDEFIQGLRKHDKLFIFYNLFSILQFCYPDFLQEIKRLRGTYKKNWFAVWHKQFRQMDICEGCWYIKDNKKVGHISGHIDSIIWQAIADSGDELYIYINVFFASKIILPKT